jgi:predicted glycoside hydrolase/deacetylase ChbG (UPF0249 family)
VETLPTSAAQPSAWIERLFLRFSAMYGNLWVQRWKDVPMDVVKAEWTAELERFSLEMIRKALDHCTAHNTLPPTLPEFSQICRQFRGGAAQAPFRDVPKLTVDDAEAKAKIAELLKSMRAKSADAGLH